MIVMAGAMPSDGRAMPGDLDHTYHSVGAMWRNEMDFARCATATSNDHTKPWKALVRTRPPTCQIVLIRTVRDLQLTSNGPREYFQARRLRQTILTYHIRLTTPTLPSPSSSGISCTPVYYHPGLPHYSMLMLSPSKRQRYNENLQPDSPVSGRNEHINRSSQY